LDVVHNLE